MASGATAFHFTIFVYSLINFRFWAFVGFSRCVQKKQLINIVSESKVTTAALFNAARFIILVLIHVKLLTAVSIYSII